MQTQKFTGGYCYGFNNMSKDDEVKGSGNSYDYVNRFFDPRLGRFLSVDKMTSSFPWYSPYHYAGNNPIVNLDLDGLEELDYATYQKGMIEGELQLRKCSFAGNKEMNLSDNPFWTKSNVTKAKGMAMRTDKGQTPSQALNHIFENPEQYSLDCGQFSQCLKLRGMQKSMGDEKFNDYIGSNFNILNHQSTGIKNVQIYDNIEGTWYKVLGVKGDETGILENFDAPAYIKSAIIGTEFTIDYNNNMPFNVLKVGDNQYFSQDLNEGGGTMTYEQLAQKLVDKIVKTILETPTEPGQPAMSEADIRSQITVDDVDIRQIKESGATIKQ